MRRLIFLTFAAALVAGCQQGAEPQRENQAESAVANNAIATPGSSADGVVALPAAAPATREEALKIMQDRHENMEKIGDAMKLISRQLKADAPDLTAVRSGARTIATFAPQIPGWFPPGTGPDVGKTEAKAEIWQKPDDFVAKAAALNEAASAFNGAAQGEDVGAMRAALGNLGKSCKACHDPYREEH